MSAKTSFSRILDGVACSLIISSFIAGSIVLVLGLLSLLTSCKSARSEVRESVVVADSAMTSERRVEAADHVSATAFGALCLDSLNIWINEYAPAASEELADSSAGKEKAADLPRPVRTIHVAATKASSVTANREESRHDLNAEDVSAAATSTVRTDKSDVAITEPPDWRGWLVALILVAVVAFIVILVRKRIISHRFHS